MDKKKVKKFVKDHAKEIIIGGGLTCIGIVIGTKIGRNQCIKHLRNEEWIKIYIDTIRDLKDSSALAAISFGENYSIDELGRLGKDIVRDGFDESRKITNFLVFSKDE